MELDLAQKHVLVPGGSKGIGFACALQFLREGARVTVAARAAAGLDEARSKLAAQGFECACLQADLADAGAALAMVDEAERRHGPIDVLVNSAGAAPQMPFAELTPEVWADAMRSKFMTTINVMDPVIKRMGQRGAGTIVNVVGMGGKAPTAHHLSGGAANAALMLATAGLANAYGRMGVRVNAVNPGSTLTERTAITAAAMAKQRDISLEEAMRERLRHLALGRIAQPEEVANAVVFLASSRASYISGVILSMDGATVPMVV